MKRPRWTIQAVPSILPTGPSPCFAPVRFISFTATNQTSQSRTSLDERPFRGTFGQVDNLPKTYKLAGRGHNIKLQASSLNENPCTFLSPGRPAKVHDWPGQKTMRPGYMDARTVETVGQRLVIRRCTAAIFRGFVCVGSCCQPLCQNRLETAFRLFSLLTLSSSPTHRLMQQLPAHAGRQTERCPRGAWYFSCCLCLMREAGHWVTGL